MEWLFVEKEGCEMSKPTKQTCTCCGKSKSLSEFYMSYSPFHKHTGRLPICKKCLFDYIDDDIDKLIDALRRIDRPFKQDLFNSSLEESEKTGTNVISLYFKNLGLSQNRELTWKDSQFEGYSDPSLAVYDDDEEELTESDLVKIWGKQSPEDYAYLENFYREYARYYSTDTPSQVNLYRNIAKVHLQAEKQLAQGRIKEFKDLMELSSKLHNDAGIKPIQSSAMDDAKGVSTYGLWIKEIEENEPCEFFEKKPVYEDFDKFKKYWENWFVRPFKNIFNLSRDFNVKDD